MVGGRNDMQRVNGLRIEEESRRRDEETAAQRGPREDFDSDRRPNRFGAFVSRIQRAVRR